MYLDKVILVLASILPLISGPSCMEHDEKTSSERLTQEEKSHGNKRGLNVEFKQTMQEQKRLILQQVLMKLKQAKSMVKLKDKQSIIYILQDCKKILTEFSNTIILPNPKFKELSEDLDGILHTQNLQEMEIKLFTMIEMIEKNSKGEATNNLTAFEASINESPLDEKGKPKFFTQANQWFEETIDLSIPPYSLMKHREEKLKDEYQVFYSGSTFKNIIIFEVFSRFRSFLSLKALSFIRIPQDEAMPKTVSEFKEKYKDDIEKADMFDLFDHKTEIMTQLASASFSLFTNFGGAEAALYFYLKNNSVSNVSDVILTHFLKFLGLSENRIQQYRQEINEYCNKLKNRRGGIMQIFIRNSEVDKLAYFSGPGGMPPEAPSAIRPIGKRFNTKELQSLAVPSLYEFLTLFRNSKKSILEIETYNKICSSVIAPQVRILVQSPLFFDPENVKIFFYFDPKDTEKTKLKEFMSKTIYPMIHQDIQTLEREGKEETDLKQPFIREAKETQKMFRRAFEQRNKPVQELFAEEFKSSRNREKLLSLIKAGADINTKDNDGMTPLHIAASEGNKGIVKLLLENGADKSAKDKNGKTPFDIAQTNVKDLFN